MPEERGGEFSAVLAAYLEAVDRGEASDRAALVARYPHFAEPFQAYFADQDRLDQLAGPMRVESKAEAASLAYELLEEIGRGGMGVVLRCRDGTLDRDLAVKVLLDRYRDRPDLVRRFIEEARITGQLQHPFIVPVHELGTLADGRPYFAMKLVEGRTFAELLAERGDPAEHQPRYLHVFEQICQTIAYAHSKGVIHRDLKPANVMVGTFGEVQVMDWGLAKAGVGDQESGVRGKESEVRSQEAGGSLDTQAGTALGTPAYMAPEQARGELERVSRRSDVFGLGVILCEILTGAPAYRGEPNSIVQQARLGRTDDAQARLDACGTEAELVALAKRCLAAEPADRPADGAAVAGAMSRYGAAVQERLRAAEIARAKAETEAVAERERLALVKAKAGADRRRRRAVVSFAMAMLLLLASAAGFGVWYHEERTAREAEIATRRAVTERDVAAALTEVRRRRDEGLKQADDPARWRVSLTAAHDALRRAQNALDLGEATDELSDEVAAMKGLLEEDERDRAFFETLERIAGPYSFINAGDFQTPTDPAPILKAFRDYGLDLEALPPRELAARIRGHRHRVRLVDEVDIVAHMQAASAAKPAKQTRQYTFRGVTVRASDWTRAARLNQILDAVDANPEAFGTRWRRARAARDVAILVGLAQSAEARRASPRAIFTLADDLGELQAFEAICELLREVQERRPTDPWINQAVGVAAVASYAAGQSRSLDDAVRFLTAAVAARGNNATSYLILSSVFYMQGKKHEGLRAAQAAVAADPASAEAHSHLGSAYVERKEWDKALACYQRAEELDPVSAARLDALGQVYASKKQIEQAITYYRSAVARAPSVVQYHINLGVAYAEKQDLDAAIAEFEKARELLPDLGMTHYNLGFMLRQKKEFDKAIAAFEKAIEYDPQYIASYYHLGELLFNHRHDPDAALQVMRRPAELQPNVAKAHFGVVHMLQFLGRHIEAEKSLRRVIDLDPIYPEAYARLGNSLGVQGKWDDAITAYRTALQQDDGRAETHDQLGLVLFAKGDYAGALECHRKALALSPSNGMIMRNIGHVQMTLGEMEEAARCLRAALVHTPRDVWCHAWLGKVLLALRDHQAALASARAALAIAPNHADARQLLAQLHWETGNFTGGLAAIRDWQATADPASAKPEVVRVQAQLFEQYVKGEEILPAVLRGDSQPGDAAQKAVLGMICGLKQRKYVAACRLIAEAFADMPRLADVTGSARFNGACYAVRAGTGEAEPDADLDAAGKEGLRRQGLTWLRAELDGWRKARQTLPPAEQGVQRFRVRRWLTDPAFTAVRDAERLAELPGDERNAWTKLWADVCALTEPGSRPTGPDLARLRTLANFPAVSQADIVERTLVTHGQALLALTLARKRAADLPTARHRYLVARCLADCGQIAAARTELHGALSVTPGDPYCLAGHAVLWLRDYPAGWREAEALLTEASQGLPPAGNPALADDVAFLVALCQAATGRSVLARIALERLQAEHAGASRYIEAIEALGP
jgi:tetratricopeptide (TPR) repeat protein